MDVSKARQGTWERGRMGVQPRGWSCLTEAVGASAIVRGLQARPTPDTGSRASPSSSTPRRRSIAFRRTSSSSGSLHVDPVMERGAQRSSEVPGGPPARAGPPQQALQHALGLADADALMGPASSSSVGEPLQARRVEGQRGRKGASPSCR